MAVAAGAAVCVAISGMVAFVIRRDPQPWLDRALLAAVATAAVAMATGIVLLATGARPEDPLHLIYGVVLLVLPLIARYLARPARTGRQSIAVGIAGLVALTVIVRLIQTG
jgi:ABC-type Fe3+ transport system permease subunit